MKHLRLILLCLIALAAFGLSAPPHSVYWLPGHGEPPLTLDAAYKTAAIAVAKADAATIPWILDRVSLSPTFLKMNPGARWENYRFVFTRALVQSGPRQECSVTIHMDSSIEVSPIVNEP